MIAEPRRPAMNHNLFTRREALACLGATGLPVERLVAQAGGAATDQPVELAPDLANLDPPLQSIARDQRPALSFLEDRWSSLGAWTDAARPAFHRHLSYDPAPVALGADVLSREPRDGFVIETLRIRATPDYDIPAKLLLPMKPAGRRPAVLALHCHSGQYVWAHEKLLSSPGEPAGLTDFRKRTYGRPWAEVLARRGYVVITIDAFYFGQRRLRVEQLEPSSVPGEVRDDFAIAVKAAPGSAAWTSAVNRVCGFYEHLTAKTIFAAGATWAGLLVWDDRRTLDYLLSRPEVDPDRVGCVGLSIGGIRTAHLIGADPRVKVACVAGWMTAFAHQLRNHLRIHTWMVYVPGLYRSLDLPDVAALHAPGALLVQQCRRDTLYPIAGMEAAVGKIAATYAKAGLSERFRGTFYDVPHSFTPDMQDEALGWFDRWL